MDLPQPDPGRYSAEIATMREMGWSWPDLCAAPPDLVEEIEFKRRVREHFAEKRRKKDEQIAKAKHG